MPADSRLEKCPCVMNPLLWASLRHGISAYGTPESRAAARSPRYGSLVNIRCPVFTGVPLDGPVPSMAIRQSTM